MKFDIGAKEENRIIRFGIIVFWWLFWLFNVVDKVIGGTEGAFFAGKDRLAQFKEYFSLIGLTSPGIASGTLTVVSLAEFLALVFFTIALWKFYQKNEKLAHAGFFWGVLVSILIFSFFAIGDQVFGERGELLEHSIYWIALVLSWYIYTKTENGK